MEKNDRFETLGTTEKGRALLLEHASAATLESALVETADELGKVLDARPSLEGAFADSRAASRGGAHFTGKLGGAAVRGWILSSTKTSSVLVALADAPAADVAALLELLPAAVTMQTHVFPDGSGSVDLPHGWTTASTSATYGVGIAGPKGQFVGIANRLVVNTPDGNLARLRLQNYHSQLAIYKTLLQGHRQALINHQRFPQLPLPKEPVAPAAPDLERDMPGLIFCRLCSGPAEVLEHLYPTIEGRARARGEPFTHLERIIEITPVDANPLIAGSQAGVAYIAVSDHKGENVTQLRALVRIETSPVFDGKDTWVVTFNNVRAPEAIFDRDLPVMLEIQQSFRVNFNVANQQIQQAGQAALKLGEESHRQLLERGRAFNEQQAAHFRSFQSRVAAHAKARHDRNSDFIEYVSGVRKVYDTRSGTSFGVDLSKADAIVDVLNASAGDRGRFVPIPLRFER